MSPKEFIEKYGIEEAKKSLAILENGGEKDEFYVELEELIDSHELVNSFGGLINAKEHLLVLAMIEEYEEMKTLSSAIADVENLK